MNLRLRFPRGWWPRSGLALKRSDLESVSREEQAQILGSMIRERRELMGINAERSGDSDQDHNASSRSPRAWLDRSFA
jgi:hypothetical protein